MKKEMMATIGMLCAASLFAQAFNTTYYAPNGGYGGSSQTTVNGNSTRTTFYNQNGTYGGSAQTFRTGIGTRTTFHNQNGMYGGSARTSPKWQYGQHVLLQCKWLVWRTLPKHDFRQPDHNTALQSVRNASRFVDTEQQHLRAAVAGERFLSQSRN